MRGGVDIIFVKILSYTVQPRTGGSISVILIENIPSESWGKQQDRLRLTWGDYSMHILKDLLESNKAHALEIPLGVANWTCFYLSL